MKKLLAVLVFFIAVLPAFAQDTARVEKKKKEPTELQKQKRANVQKAFFKESKDRFAIDLLGNNWIYSSSGDRMNGLKTKWYSRGINIYFYWNFRIKKSRFSIAPGLGYSASNIYHRHEMLVDTNGITFTPLANPGDYKVNKLTLQYFDIPIEFRIHTKPDKLDNMWKFAFGFKAGIRVDAHTKEKIKTNVTKVYVERRFPDVNLFRMGPTIRIGYSSFNITAYYGILNVFKKDRGPRANEFSIGISFNGL